MALKKAFSPGKKPGGNEKVGSLVSWEEDFSCYKSSNGYYWHGNRGGRWKNYPVDPTPQQLEEGQRIEAVRRKKPRENERTGRVFWDNDHSCYKNSNGYYWHGKEGGQWKLYPPGADPTPQQLEEERLAKEEKRRKRLLAQRRTMKRIRQPKGNKTVGLKVTFNVKHDCYETDEGFYWHGRRKGGWKTQLPSDDEDEKVESRKCL